jgi:hypothetical protein
LIYVNADTASIPKASTSARPAAVTFAAAGETRPRRLQSVHRFSLDFFLSVGLAPAAKSEFRPTNAQ